VVVSDEIYGGVVSLKAGEKCKSKQKFKKKKCRFSPKETAKFLK
jgi:hypothetical protein